VNEVFVDSFYFFAILNPGDEADSDAASPATTASPCATGSAGRFPWCSLADSGLDLAKQEGAAHAARHAVVPVGH
jgi:hypothetical protein